MRHRFLFAAVAACMLTSASAFAYDENPIIIKFSHVVTKETPKGKGAERFKELAEKAEWRKALLPVRKEVEGRVGKAVLAAVDKESTALGGQ